MFVVIQCASTKQPEAGTLRTRDNRRVTFVARPECAPATEGVLWARPDDASDVAGDTWRRRVEAANADPGGPPGLLRAIELYRPQAFARLARAFGTERVFILSAGWGLVRADFRLPAYDITFSKQAESYKRRASGDHYDDFGQLPAGAGPVTFLGGRDYLPLFSALTRHLRVPITIPFRCDSSGSPGIRREGNVRFVPFPTTAKTNWHYGCANRLCEEPSFLEEVR